MQNNVLNIVFVTDGLPFNGDTIKTKALGGSETAMIYVSNEMARKGHIVTVFNRCDAPGLYDSVQYYHNSEIDRFMRYGECDVLIVSRHFGFLTNKYNSRLNILWNHDIPADIEKLAAIEWNIDRVWCLSDYHKSLYAKALPDIKELITIQSNGYDSRLCVKSDKKHKIMFTSRPERGLMKALDYYESLGDKELEFLACSYKTIDNDYVRNTESIVNDRLIDLKEKGYNVQIGSFNKEDLYQHISESKAVIYPTDFPEIFCISAIEAQANGTPFITSADFALNETVAYPGVPKNEVFDNAFIATMKAVIYDDNQRAEYIKSGYDFVKKYEWSNVVDNMLRDIENTFDSRCLDKEGIIKALYYESDLVSALEYAKEHDMNDWIERLENDLRFVMGKNDYAEIYEDESTHEKGELRLDEMYKNPRAQWISDTIKECGAKSVFDYACHTGSNSQYAKMHNSELEIYGYDISEKAIETANFRLSDQFKEFSNVTYSTTLPKKKFDCVILGEILEHVLDFESFVDHIEETYLNDGGKMIITLPRGSWEHLTRIKNQSNPVQYHIHAFDAYDVIHLFGQKTDFYYTTTFFCEGYNGESLGHYLIEYTKDESAITKRDYMRKWSLIRPYQDITLCMIVRDAEKTIEKTLDQVYEHVDAIHICLDHDPGENKVLEDRLEAYSKNTQTKDFKYWHLKKRIVKDKYGFANARNESISKVNTKWILWLDSDEDFLCYDRLRRYLDNAHVNAYSIAQHHIEIDSKMSPDNPNRLFRTGQGVFYGYIHEQAMSVDDMNKPITPALRLVTCNIANNGELTEQIRRKKAQGRNLVLLHKDTVENVDNRRKNGLPIRKLTIILIIRDLLNRIKWGAEKFGTYKTRDAIEHCLPKMLKLYFTYFKDEKDNLYYLEARKYINEALVLTGKGTMIEVNIGGSIRKTVVLNESVKSIEDDLRDLI